ncbi:MAG TPA: hypothetical protein VJ302_30730 [Blastocatellia bacterium]|nr:hypothetical protein [Blastocatellia bacterium]
MVGTKPSSLPRHLEHWIGAALEFDSLPEGSAPVYPEVLTAQEWAAVKALNNARAEVRDRELRDQQAASDVNARGARLQARLQQG